MLELIPVIGITENNIFIIGSLIGGKIKNKNKTYYVKNLDGKIIECVKCIENSNK